MLLAEAAQGTLNPLPVSDLMSHNAVSTSTKGKHMVDVFNKLGVHSAVIGNHDIGAFLSDFVAYALYLLVNHYL